YRVSREIRRYRGVQTIQDYVARRKEAVDLALGQGPVPIPGYPIAQPPGLESDRPAQGDEQEEGTRDEAARRVFVIMPFDARLNPVYAGIRDACAADGVGCRRADEIDEVGRITEQIYEELQGADAI